MKSTRPTASAPPATGGFGLPARVAEPTTTATRARKTPTTGTDRRRWPRRGSGPVSSLPGISTMIANTKSTAMAPA